MFFNATSLSNALHLIGRVFTGWEASPLITPLLIFTIVCFVAVQFVPVGLVDWAQSSFSRQRLSVQATALGLGLLVITTLGPAGVAPFIYYKF